MSTNKITRNRVEEIFSEVRYKTVSVKLWLIQKKVPLRELIETQTKSKDHDDRVLACRNVRNSVTLRLEDSTRNKNPEKPPEIPRSCGLFSLATWVPSVPTGSSRWPTTVVVFLHRRRRRPVPPLDRALFSLATSITRRWTKLFSLAKHDHQNPPLPLPWPSAHLLATFSLLFTLAWAIRRLLRSFPDEEPNPRRVASSVSHSVSAVVSVVGSVYPDVLGCAFVVGKLIFWDGKRKDQFLEALFRASLVGASRLKVKGRPAR